LTPYWLVLWVAIAMSMAGQTMLKAGAQADTFMHQLFDWRTLLGLCVYGSASIFYIVALRKIPMSVALPCTAVSYVAAALIGHFVFGEALGVMRIGAILLISGGVALLVL
jgi:multidrug transporter EmrE-like cation transporter